MKIGTNHVEAFSDGMMAIILTIMMLELKLLDLNKHISTKGHIGTDSSFITLSHYLCF